jgi:hypothetical protein
MNATDDEIAALRRAVGIALATTVALCAVVAAAIDPLAWVLVLLTLILGGLWIVACR